RIIFLAVARICSLKHIWVTTESRSGFPPDPNGSSQTRSAPPRPPPPGGRFFLDRKELEARTHRRVCRWHRLDRARRRRPCASAFACGHVELTGNSPSPCRRVNNPLMVSRFNPTDRAGALYAVSPIHFAGRGLALLAIVGCRKYLFHRAQQSRMNRANH